MRIASLISGESSTKEIVLIRLAELRANIVQMTVEPRWRERVDAFCAALPIWYELPEIGRVSYARELIELLFDIVSALEEAPELDAQQVGVLELSLWDVANEFNLLNYDTKRATFISRRRVRMLESSRAAAGHGAERFLFDWTLLLIRPRLGPIRQLPGPFKEDVACVISYLSEADLPRRAKAMAQKFQMRVEPMVQLAIQHRPESDEEQRTRKLIERIESMSEPVPLSVAACARKLKTVLQAPVAKLPLTVSGNGIITVR
jgi:hypothetical protein